MIASLLALVAPEAAVIPTVAPRPLPSWAIRYVSTWRTRYAIDGIEVEFEDVQRRAESLEVEHVHVGGDWQIRWLIFRTKPDGP